ncbi:FHA domain-containing protein [Leifsonia sp. SIMBA_070]|uniref:FHA domain-containing protein n=1 Tax=Leifsonia sp. SIMBA_070 TaxID=3085810 RepID=UPI00397A9290
MDDSGFIVPPPGLIPSCPSPSSPGASDGPVPVRPLPAFTPPPGPGAPPAPVRPVWRLLLPGGRAVPVTRTILVGRNPSRSAYAGADAADAELIALDDPTSTVSKTHAALTPEGDTLRVTDLHSTNGVLVGGARAEPGEPTIVPPGARLLLGDLLVDAERS